MLSDSPPERKLEWTNSGIDGSNKYLLKVWKFFNSLPLNEVSYQENYTYEDKKNIHLREKTHYYIDRITKSLDRFQYNVSVALIREYSNIFLSLDVNNTDEEQLIALKFSLTKWIILISPMTPHLAEELWKKIGYKKSLVSDQAWPKADLKFISDSNVNIVIQVNGKKKLVLKIPKDLTVEETKALLMEKDDIKEILGNNKIKKVITVPNKIFSIVI
jgi:leucyl-tRNA synthetase